MRSVGLFILLFVSRLCFAQFTDKQLYEGYLTQDLTSWREYVSTADWENMTAAERTRLINYEYGLVPVEIDRGSSNSRSLLDTYKAHIEAHKGTLTSSQYAAYMSAAHAYEYLLDKSSLLSEGLVAFRLATKAVEEDPANPVALSLKGNVDFYAPAIFGGSKKKALKLFLEAEKIMRHDVAFRYLWNYPALQLCIAQCYEKTDRIKKAIAKCEEILREHPDFVYVRDEYLPSLRKK